MFDLGFSELLLIAVVALVVLGPERLPKATRFAGLWVRRARAQWYSVKSELERELAADEMKRSLQETREAMRALDERSRSAGESMRREFDGVRGQVLEGLDPSSPPVGMTPTDNRDDIAAEPPAGPVPAAELAAEPMQARMPAPPGMEPAPAPATPSFAAPGAGDAAIDDQRR